MFLIWNPQKWDMKEPKVRMGYNQRVASWRLLSLHHRTLGTELWGDHIPFR